jgi:hypothetical protein
VGLDHGIRRTYDSHFWVAQARGETPPCCWRCGFCSGKNRGEEQSGRRLMVGLLDNAKYWRCRAEEARVVAESLVDTQTKRIMLGIAGDYERIAELVEQRVETGGLPAAPWPG